MASKVPKSSIYPPPLVIPPLAGPQAHKQTFIVLHGRGSQASDFGPGLLYTRIPIPGYESLREALPHARFVFPTASIRRATIYKRSPITQWFDNWSLIRGGGLEREELQFEGLKESSRYIQELIEKEAELVGGRQKVVLGGLSQGCAMALMTLLSWTGKDNFYNGQDDEENSREVSEQNERGYLKRENMVGALFGMCGWLPLSNHLCRDSDDSRSTLKYEEDEEAEDEDEDDLFQRGQEPQDIDDGEDPFDRSPDPDRQPPPNTTFNEQALTAIEKRIITLRHDLLDIPLPSSHQFPSSSKTTTTKPDLSFQSIPIFLGHGTEDDIVPVSLGRRAIRCLRDLGVGEVEWKEYPELHAASVSARRRSRDAVGLPIRNGDRHHATVQDSPGVGDPTVRVARRHDEGPADCFQRPLAVVNRVHEVGLCQRPMIAYLEAVVVLLVVPMPN
ncbi:MAG: hypothetical protein M1823_000724 [Watsoniomyces obsoletus]|nr:MAG: hypothetical protein M1823_000724 [Watsoniomyces obsoletus]